MNVPTIDYLRERAGDLIARCGRGQLEAIMAGAVAAKNAGTPLDYQATAQTLISECQQVIDQASTDALAIFVREFMEFLVNSGGGAPGPGAGVTTIVAGPGIIVDQPDGVVTIGATTSPTFYTGDGVVEGPRTVGGGNNPITIQDFISFLLNTDSTGTDPRSAHISITGDKINFSQVEVQAENDAGDVAGIKAVADATGGELTLSANQKMFFKTKSVIDQTVVAGQVQTMLDPVTGETDYRNSAAGISVLSYGALGDNTADDTAAFVAALAAAAALTTGDKVVLIPPLTYKLTAPLTFPVDTRIVAYGATINWHASGNVTGHRLSSGSVVRGGTWNTISDVAPSPDSGVYQTNFISGTYYGLGSAAQNFRIQDVTLTNTKPNANGIMILGDSYNWEVSNVIVPSSATLARPIAVHWGSGADPTLGTYHPSCGTISRIKVGALTYNSIETCPVHVSGGIAITVEDVECDEAGTGILVYAGDYGYTYGPAAMGAVSYEDCAVRICRNSGIYVYGKQTLNGSIGTDFNVEIGNCSVSCPAIAASTGIQIESQGGTTISNCVVHGFNFGVYPKDDIKNLTINGGRISGSTNAGVYWFRSSSRPKNLILEGVEFRGNGISQVGAAACAIFLDDSDNTQIKGCLFGDAVAANETQQVSIRVNPNATDVLIHNNHTLSVKSGGLNQAYSLGNAATLGVFKSVMNNTAAAGITLYVGADISKVLSKVSSISGSIYRGNAMVFPTAGTFVGGDMLLFDNPGRGALGATCIFGGTPGTWKLFGSVLDIGVLSDADATLTWGVSAGTQYLTAPLTADRKVTIAAGTVYGSRIKVTRTLFSTGDFNLTVEGVNISTGQWAEFEWNLSSWQQLSAGSLVGLIDNVSRVLTINTEVPTVGTTVTVSIASPSVVSWTAHGLVAGQPISLFSTVALPTGIIAQKIYYVIASGLTANSFQIASSPGGTAIVTTGTQSGTVTSTTYGATMTALPSVTPSVIILSSVLAANRVVTLSTSLAKQSSVWRFTRTVASTGAFNWDIGGLKILAPGQWCEVGYNGSAWVLTQFGSL